MVGTAAGQGRFGQIPGVAMVAMAHEARVRAAFGPVAGEELMMKLVRVELGCRRMSILLFSGFPESSNPRLRAQGYIVSTRVLLLSRSLQLTEYYW